MGLLILGKKLYQLFVEQYHIQVRANTCSFSPTFGVDIGLRGC